MAFGNFTVVTVDPTGTGSDANGGGFDATVAGGTNYSWGVSQQVIAYTDIVIGGTTTQGTSVIRPFIAADKGNIIKLPAGGGFTGGRFQIRSVAAGVATFDRSLGTAASTGGSGNLGGALATVQEGMDTAWKNAGAVADAEVWVYGHRTYSITAALNTTSGVSPVGYANVLAGFYTDSNPQVASGGQPTIAVGAGAGVKGIAVTIAGMNVWNLTFDGTATSGTQGTKGIDMNGFFHSCFNCKAMNWSQEAYIETGTTNGNNNVAKLEATGSAGTAAAVTLGLSCTASFLFVHKNTQIGVAFQNSAAPAYALNHSVIANNSGATSDGVVISYGCSVIHCTIYGNGRDGIRGTSQAYVYAIGTVVMNNILAKNVAKGLMSVTVPTVTQSFPRLDYNAYYSNGANYQNLAAGAHDVALSVNPFVSSDSDLAAETNPNWGLNTTASAGASLRAAGYPGQFPGLTTTASYPDIGAVQHQDPAGTGAFSPLRSPVITTRT